MNYTIRISRGKPLSKSIKKIIHSMNNSEKRISKVQRTLAKKCLKNKMNKLILKCSVCLKNTEISLNKPQKEKVQKITLENIQSSKKKKKKRIKDKTAGLNISGISSLDAKDVTKELKEKNKEKMESIKNLTTPNQKLKKLNIKKLKDVMNEHATSRKRRSLHSFLTELCWK